MAEQRHTEKNMLFLLLRAQNKAKTPEDLNEVISCLKATMEPEDVELVEKRVAEFEKN